MSETFCRIPSTDTSNQSLKEKSIDINKEFESLTNETPAILCKEDDGKMKPAAAPTTVEAPPAGTTLPLYVYTKGSVYYEGTTPYGLVSVLGAAGIVRMTLAPGSAISAGDLVVLTGTAGKVTKYIAANANYQVIVGVALRTLASAESDQELLVNSTVPRVVEPAP